MQYLIVTFTASWQQHRNYYHSEKENDGNICNWQCCPVPAVRLAHLIHEDFIPSRGRRKWMLVADSIKDTLTAAEVIDAKYDTLF
jgi:hypothetical protein